MKKKKDKMDAWRKVGLIIIYLMIILLVYLFVTKIILKESFNPDLQELLIDECNNNPNSENCFCEEKGYEDFEDINIQIIYDGLKDILADDCDIINKECLFTKILLEERISMFEIIFDKTCTKARPKTKCEKGDEDFIETEICDKPITITTRIENGTLIHEVKCPNLKTICREKTDVEKRITKIIERNDCENIKHQINRCREFFDCGVERLYNMKQAFREKQCTI